MIATNRLLFGAAMAAASLAGPAKAQTLVEQAAEFRMQIDFAVPDAKTKNLVNALTKLDAQHALLVDDGGNVSLRRSSSNLQKALHIAPEGVNVYDILRHPKLLISEAALRRVEARLMGHHDESAESESEGATP